MVASACQGQVCVVSSSISVVVDPIYGLASTVCNADYCLQINGMNSGHASQSWLAPRSKHAAGQHNKANTITVVLPHAVALSKLRLWNYHKNPERGACEIEVLLDDQLIYFGYLRKAAPPSALRQALHSTLLFSNHPADIEAERPHVKYNVADMERDHLTLIDERVVKNKGITFVPPAAANERPSTAVVM